MDKESNSNFPNPFWDYALRIYGREAMRGLCLDLQDREQADVTLILFLLWRASEGAPPPEQGDISAMIAATQPVRHRAIEPLRGLRRIMKNPFPDDLPDLRENLRQRLLEAELAAESLAMTLLYMRFPLPEQAPQADRTQSGTTALTRYLAQIGMDQDQASASAEQLSRSA